MTLTTRSRRFAAGVAGASAGLLAVGLVAAVPASAAESPAVINPGNIPTTADAYENGESCPVMGDEGDDIWHFVAPGQGATFTALLVTFDLDGDDQTTGDQITRSLSDAVQFPSAKHAYVATPAGYTLIDGTATINNATVTLGKTDIFFFNLSHTCTGGGGTVTPKSVLSGAKYYDANHNGRRDTGEVGIAGWPIQINDDVLYTDVDGNFTKNNLINGSYDIFEIQSANAAWKQTGNTEDQTSKTGSAFVSLSNFEYNVLITGESTVSRLYFGNVCEITNTGGYTLGFWSNKNGQSAMQSYGMALALAQLSALNLRNGDGSNFDPTTYNQFRNWLLNATATNAAYMLSAQMATTFLDTKVPVGGKVLNDGLLVKAYDGSWITISEAITAANNSLAGGAILVIGANSPLRDFAQYYLKLFDDLNNNRATVTPATPAGCPAPFSV